MKPIWQSKTFWANLIAATVAVAEETNMIDLLPAEYQTLFTIALAVANIALRMVTVEPVTARVRK